MTSTILLPIIALGLAISVGRMGVDFTTDMDVDHEPTNETRKGTAA
jgi:hypothetical protein